MTISLAFLAPDLVKAAIDGRLPHGMGVARLCDLPAEWSRQRQMLGLAALPPVERNFEARDKAAKTAVSTSASLSRDNKPRDNARQRRAFRAASGNLRFRGTAWWAREDSNLQPDRYERGAYPGRSIGAPT
jgi:hypothetical protein